MTRHLPGISVVLISTGGAVYLRRCLEWFSNCWAQADAEVIIVRAGSSEDLTALANQFSTATWIVAEPGTTDVDLRRIGFERSSRDTILFLDDRDSERHEWAASFCQNWRPWVGTGGRVIGAPTCGAERSPVYPYLSVVMPVRNGGPRFLLALQAMALTDLPRQQWELVIVDDGSGDETASVAAQYADKLLRLRHGPRGPGYARNRGFELTLGECVAFVNADVMVESDTLRNAVTILAEQTEVGAIFGSCDASPTAPGFLSQYRTLVQRYYHYREADDPVTFSSACGFIRSSVFERAGGYDEWHFQRRQLEDLELSQRIRSLGGRIVLHPDIRASHLKPWTLRRMIATEIFDRTVPWMRLVKGILTNNHRGAHRNRRSKSANIILSWLGVVCTMLAWSKHSVPFSLGAFVCLAAVLRNNAEQLAFFARERGAQFAVASVPIDVLYFLISGVGVVTGWIIRQTVGEPTPGAVAEAFAEIGVRHWPPVPVKRVARPPAESELLTLHGPPEQVPAASPDQSAMPETSEAPPQLQ